MRRRSIVAVSVLWLALAVGVADARVVEPDNLDPGLLKVQVSLDKEAFQVGEPITADIAITNLSKGAIRVEDFEDFTGRMDGFQVKALTSDGKEIPPGRYFLFREAIGRSVAVQPAETYRRTFVANYQAPVREPGSYTLQVAFRVRTKPLTKVQSEPVAFRILQTSEGQIQTRVEQLKKRLAEGERPADIIPLLGVTGSTAAIPLLIEFLQSPDDSVQAPAAEALQIADTRAVGKAVMQSLKEHGPRPRMVYLMRWKLDIPAGEMIDALIPYLKDGDPARRYAAMYGLAMWKPPAGRGDELYGYGLAGLKDESPDVRRAATNVVGNADGPGALAALRPMLSDPDESVRVEAVTQVAWLGNPGSVDALIDVLKDQDGKPAEVAAGWLATFGGEEAENALAAALAKSHSQRLADAIKEGRKAREWLSREEPAKKD